MIEVDAKNAAVANVDALSGYATAQLRVPAGSHVFTVVAYDRPKAAGKVLSFGSTVPTYVAPTGLTSVHLTLGGAIASVVLTLDYPQATVGSPATTDLHVMAKDADGNVMLSNSSFASPLTLVSSDPAHVQFSRNDLTTAPDEIYGVNPVVKIVYDGARVPSVSFTAMTTGLAPSAVTRATLALLPPPSTGSQLFGSGDPGVLDSSTLPGRQVLGTYGTLDTYGQGSYGPTAYDPGTKLLYVAQLLSVFANGSVSTTIDILNTNPLVSAGSFGSQGYSSLYGCLALDSTTGSLFVNDQADDVIAVYEMSAGHRRIGTIADGAASFAVDATTHRLYVASGRPGLAVYSTVPPFAYIATIAAGGQFTPAFYSDLTIDSQRHRLYALKPNRPEEPSFVEAVDLSAPKLDPTVVLTFGYLESVDSLAIDSQADRLYVSLLSFSPIDPTNIYGDFTISSYDIGRGNALVETDFTRTPHFLTVAPIAP